MTTRDLTWRLTVATMTLAGALALSGCAAPVAGPAPEASSSAEAPTENTDSAPEAWAECPGIVERLNANEDDPTVYEQIPAADYDVPEVGPDLLASACVIQVTVNDEPITWAIVPGDAGVADAAIANLESTSFASVGLGTYGNASTGQAVLVQSFETGAELDAFLVYSTAFEPIDEPIVYLGTFILS
jgi:hypothetical protein